MNKKPLNYFAIVALVLGLSSCKSDENNTVYNVMSLPTMSCSSTDEQLETSLVCVENNVAKRPFDSGMTIKLYNIDEKRIDEVSKDYIDTISRISAIYDRHETYKIRINGKFKNLYNLKRFNSDIEDLFKSTEKKKVVSFENDLELYKGIKIAYDFSLNSVVTINDKEKHMKYNLAIGALSDLYNKYIDKNIGTPIGNDFFVVQGSDFTTSEFEKAKNAVPTYDELLNLFTFDDEKKTITINRIKEYNDDIYPSITLSGFAKGYAETYFKSLHSDMSFLINGGSSSIMTNKVKVGDVPWKIRIDNPVYNEEGTFFSTGFGIVLSDLNPQEVLFEKKGDFVISTSGYYNNYYYTKNDDDKFILRHHIIDSYTGLSPSVLDSVTILINDAGLGDMYSTALMNCDDVTQAEELRKNLDKVYGFDTSAIYMSHQKLNENSKDRMDIKNNISVYVSSSLKDHVSILKDLKYDTISKITVIN